MSEIFFTSDLHLCHDKEFLYKPRGFSTIDEHDEAIIKNWNETVATDDTVFVLGDIIMGEDRKGGLEKVGRLNGKIIFCRGNHDTDTKINDYLALDNVDTELSTNNLYANVIKIGKWRFYICHRPTIMTDFNCIKQSHREFCLHGHTHSNDRFQFLQFCCYNIALNAHNNRPVNVKEIQEDLKQKIQEMYNAKENCRSDYISQLRDG